MKILWVATKSPWPAVDGGRHVGERPRVVSVQPVRPPPESDEQVEVEISVVVRPRHGLCSVCSEQFGLDSREGRRLRLERRLARRPDFTRVAAPGSQQNGQGKNHRA